ncbi:hypothetical protein MNO11_15275 [Serratia plymuthica]|uniref:hypothetical protein n=1 Tax=Serratia plymuthica TaxID=82996 RepID=UPI001F53882C|nr:hypothetical protein [Serratia plymuthica]UNK26206.1 hypothetical protein MNO11_15275 [Serratia plymuthica]
MAERYNTLNPRPSNSMKDLNDNALAYDDFLNGEQEVAYDRFQNPFPTVRKQVSERINEIIGAQQDAEVYAKDAKQSAEDAQNIADANTYYTTQEDPDGTIAGIAGTPDGKMFRVAIPDAEGVTVAFNNYKNNIGVAEFINSIANKRYIDELAKITKYLDSVFPEIIATRIIGLHAAIMTLDGVGLMTIDDQNYAQFAGMKDKLQQRLSFIGDWQTANSIVGWHQLFETADGIISGGIDSELKFRLAGMRDAVQERLAQLGDYNTSRMFDGLHFVGLTDGTLKNAWGYVGADLKMRLAGMTIPVNDLEDAVSSLIKVNDNKLSLFASNKDISPIWDRESVISASPISDIGVVFTYKTSSGNTGSGVITKVAPQGNYKTREFNVDAVTANLFAVTGQSLAATQAGTSVVTHDPSLDGYATMYSGEGQDRGPVNNETVDQTKLGALTDLAPPVQSRGPGTTQHVLRELRSASLPMPIITSRSHAFGGASYEQLKKGTNTYNAGQAAAAEFVRQMRAMGKTPSVPSLVITHGEADSAMVNAVGQYYSRLNQWANDHQNDYQALTGQAEKTRIFVDQLGSRVRTVSPTSGDVIYGDYIARDQLQLSRDRADVILITPKYHLNRLYPIDQQHLNQRGYTVLDEYVGQAVYWTLFDTVNNPTHQKWNPVQVESWTIVGNVLRINFKTTPLGHALTIDNETLGAAPFGGVDFEQGTALINHFEQVGDFAFEWGLNHAPTASDFIRLGFNATDPGGFPPPYDTWTFPLVNIRDTSPVTSRYVTGAHLWNWAALDRIPVL